eukprot:TRINITY_DN17696_c0_g2_i1.p1 TRINITY_DN17696_c0_g2~~TRINITY_DN17696_c0_g2_i1.p1  ORF type:complete len:642 (+),score=110.59 TRINITY_DN17696_c0_g2_i1:34-1959(+)
MPLQMDISVKEALLNDPRVLEDLTAQGLGALRTPEVQRKIVDICLERFPDDADNTRTTVNSWADDDEVVQKVIEALPNQRTPEWIMMIKKCWASISDSVEAFARAGRTSVKLLAFVGGVFSSVLALLYMANIVSDIRDPSELLVLIYQFLFGVLIAIVQASPFKFAKVGALHDLQNNVVKQVPFLLTDVGSGLFVFWQGLWWIHEDLGQVVASLGGVYLCVVGVLFILVDFGFEIAPSIASRSRRDTKTSVNGDVELVPLTSNDANAMETGVASSSASAASAGHAGNGGSGCVSSATSRGNVRFAAGTQGAPPVSAAQPASPGQPVPQVKVQPAASPAKPASEANLVSREQPVASPAKPVTQVEPASPVQSAASPAKPETLVEPASPVQPAASPAKPVTKVEPASPEQPLASPAKPETQVELASPEQPSALPAKPVTQVETASSVQPAASPAKPVTQVEPASTLKPAASPAKPATQAEAASPEQPAALPAKPVTQVETASSVQPVAPPAKPVAQVELASPAMAAGVQQDMGKAKEPADVESTGNVAQAAQHPAVAATVDQSVGNPTEPASQAAAATVNGSTVNAEQPASPLPAPNIDKNAINATQPTLQTDTGTAVVKCTSVAKDPESTPAAVAVSKDVGK